MAPNEIAEEQIEILQERIRSLLGIHREQLTFGSR
jgi:hypothetical protein